MASDNRRHRQSTATPAPTSVGRGDPRARREVVAEKVAEKARRRTRRRQGRRGGSARADGRAKAALKAEALDRVAEHLGALDVWTRVEPAARRPRFTRDEIAATAMRIADAEGFDAVSMRRIATELDAGTMTLYHYVRTKDELLTLVVDAVMGEVVLPADEPMPERLARRAHAARRAHRAPSLRASSVDPRHRRRSRRSVRTACGTSTSRCRRSRRCRSASPTSSTS